MNKLLFLIFFTISVTAQIKGVVKDSITGEPIPYVSIWVENENIGVSSEKDGTFELNIKEEKKIQFSMLGYKDKAESINSTEVYLLVPTVNKIEQIEVKGLKKNKSFKIGLSNKSNLSQLQGKNPQILAKKFEFDTIYNQTPFLKEIEVFTKSEIKNATFKLRILAFDKEKQLPGKNLIDDNIIVLVKEGQKKNVIDVSNYNIEFPKDGIVVGVENIIIEKNKYIYSKNETFKDHICYAPAIVLNYSDQENSYMFTNLKWNKRKKKHGLFW